MSDEELSEEEKKKRRQARKRAEKHRKARKRQKRRKSHQGGKSLLTEENPAPGVNQRSFQNEGRNIDTTRQDIPPRPTEEDDEDDE